VVGLDNVPDALPLETTELPERVVLLFGQEGTGLTGAALAACDQVLHIAQYGSTRSLNAGAAAAIALHAWVRRWRFGQRPG
jgi:tRNA G18 (ribose-2'-O)-methylase SpoU